MFQRKPYHSTDNDFAPEQVSHLSQQPTADQRRVSAPPRAILGSGISIDGCLRTEGEIEIDGEIRGDVRCAHLTVGKSGKVTGEIKADEVVIRGNVFGPIQAKRVILQDSAHVVGEIQHDRLAIEEGAHFIGASVRLEATTQNSKSGTPSPDSPHDASE